MAPGNAAGYDGIDDFLCMLRPVVIPIFFTLSYRVRDGTPYLREAWRALIPNEINGMSKGDLHETFHLPLPFFTSSMAAMMSCLVYCLYRFHSSLWLGT